MDLAVRAGKRIGRLATVPTTVPASERLLRQAAADAGRECAVNVRLCGEPFRALKAGNPDKHNEMLLAEIDALSNEVDAIVLAQVSMTALEPLLARTRVPVYNSGRTAFNEIRKRLEAV